MMHEIAAGLGAMLIVVFLLAAAHMCRILWSWGLRRRRGLTVPRGL